MHPQYIYNMAINGRRETPPLDAKVGVVEFKMWNNGLVLSFLSGIVVSIYSLLGKLREESSFLEVSFTRGIMIGCFMFTWSARRGDKPLDWLYKQPIRTLAWLLGRSVSSFVAVTSMFAVYPRIPLGDAAAIFGAAPIFTGLIGVVLIGEAWQRKHVYLTILAWSGIALIYKPQFLSDILSLGDSLDTDRVQQSTSKFYMGVALLVPLSTSTSFIISRKLSPTVSPQLIAGFTSFGASLFAFVAMVATGNLGIPAVVDWKYLIPEAMLGIASQTLMGWALQREKAAPVTLMRNSNILASFLLQYALFGTLPGWTSAVGAGLIILSTALC